MRSYSRAQNKEKKYFFKKYIRKLKLEKRTTLAEYNII